MAELVYLREATVAYYRSYKSPQKITFAIPNGEPGSGLTVFVGANNSGKTTLLEALTLTSEKKIGDAERVGAEEPELTFRFTSGEKRALTTAQKDSAQLVGGEADLHIVPSRRFWESQDASDHSVETIFYVSKAREQMRKPSSVFSVAGILKNIEKEKSERDSFTAELKKIFPNFTSWYVGNDGNNDYIGYKTSGGIKHRTDFMGDGVSSVFRILSHLQLGEGGLIIDEPELSLQPEAQKKLLELIAEKSKYRQIIISTHSPYFINLEHYKNGAVYGRVNKHDDEESKIYFLKNYSTYESIFKGANWEMPFLFDEVSKEVFFQDNILFLEGQQDVGLIKQYLTQSGIEQNFNYFGYGVRGYNNFKFALQFALDLGINKAAVVVDKGEKEDIVFAELVKEFSPKFLIHQWSKQDIRDKNSCVGCQKSDCKICKPHAISKEGFFDDKGAIKPSEQVTFLEELNVVLDYFAVK